MPHVVLLGDSVLDNGFYVPGEPDVAAQLRSILPDGWLVTRRAVDGSITREVGDQVDAIPNDATHMVVSSGGNDALNAQGVLEEPVGVVAGALERLSSVIEAFRQDYAGLASKLASRGLPTIACTVYNPNDPSPSYVAATSTALAVYNDAIVSVAAIAGFDILDLRRIFTSPADYANPIEPSAVGGAKLAGAIREKLLANEAERSARTSFWP